MAYDRACQRCGIKVHVPDDATRDYINGKLFYDKRKHGQRGRCLTQDITIGTVKLQQGDRLEPSFSLPIVHVFKSCQTPITITFWRMENNSLSKHRCPIFDVELSVSVPFTLCIDALHCVYLGWMKDFCKFVIWWLIENDGFGVWSTNDEKLANTVSIVAQDLKRWYSKRAKLHKGENLTRISYFSARIVGDFADPHPRTKGAETWGFLLYLTDKLKAREVNLGLDATRLRRAAEACIGMIKVWKAQPVKFSEAAISECFDLWNVYLSETESFDITTPKSHMQVHLLGQIYWFGNPQEYSLWEDESLNKALKQSCRSLSQATFDKTIIQIMTERLRRRGLKRSEKKTAVLKVHIKTKKKNWGRHGARQGNLWSHRADNRRGSLIKLAFYFPTPRCNGRSRKPKNPQTLNNSPHNLMTPTSPPQNSCLVGGRLQ